MKLAYFVLWIAPALALAQFNPHGPLTSCVPENEAIACEIFVRGEIDRDLSGVVRKWIAAASNRHIYVYLDSSGGSVRDALDIAEAIRSVNATVVVPVGSRCVSACVLLLAGGTYRNAPGDVLIHRPFFLSGTGDVDSLRSDLNTIGASIRRFLSDGGVRPDLYDEMLAVPPEHVRALDQAEKWRSGLARNDPAIDERDALQAMSVYGIDRHEFNRRAALARTACIVLPGDAMVVHSCVERVRQGGAP